MVKWFHPFHLVSWSPWPIFSSFASMNLMLSIYSYMNSVLNVNMVFICMFTTIMIVGQWWRDVVRESTYQGFHTSMVSKGIYLGFIMFIASEVMFFFSFFFGYFFLALNPDIATGGLWPPVGIAPVDYSLMPMLNTIILLSSGVSLTWSHHSLISKNAMESKLGLFVTISQGITFSFLQFMEYYNCSFSLADGVFGSMFYISTGFHGIHVIIGTMYLLISFMRMSTNHMSNDHHVCFETAAWYWHFVDVVWLFLFLIIYWWSY